MAMLNNQRVILGMTISNDQDLGLVDIAYNSPKKHGGFGHKRKCVELDCKQNHRGKNPLASG